MPELNIVTGGMPAMPSFAEMRRTVLIAPSGVAALDGVAASLRSSCPELSRVLQSSAVRTDAERWQRQDAAAGEQQRRLIREATAANVCLMLAGVLSGLVLAGASVREAVDGAWQGFVTANGVSWLVLALGIGTLAFGALAAMFGHIARDQDRLGRWRMQRAAAEVAKLDAFRMIARDAADCGPAAAMYGLAVVTGHLLDDQRAWLARKAREHRRSSEWTSIWGGLATALAFVGGSGAVIGGFTANAAWVAIAGVLGAALAAYAVNREALRHDRANANRYEKTQSLLDGLAARADVVAAEIEAGKPEALVLFMDAVTEPMEAEHKEWLEAVTQTESALAGLDRRLEQMRGSRS